jgi:hypothetical protein
VVALRWQSQVIGRVISLERDYGSGATMPEKSPQKPAGKKPGKSLKEKREAKRDKKVTRIGK